MELIPVLQSGKLIVIHGCTGASEIISTLIAELALRAPLHVLDGGNRFAAYKIMRLIRKRTTDVSRIAGRIILQRAFTCYQMLSLLEGIAPGKTPCLALDLRALWKCRVEKRDLFTGVIPVLQAEVTRPAEISSLFMRTPQAFPNPTYYDADIPTKNSLYRRST